MEIDPWSMDKIDDYDELMDEFGISDIGELLEKISSPHLYFSREIVFGERGYGSIINAINSNHRFSALSGFVPSGEPHLGHKMVMDQLIWHQNQGGDVFAAIADMEAFSARDISLEKGRKLGESYLLSLIALGLDSNGSYFYFQSKEHDLRDLAFKLSENVNIGSLESIYGFDEESSLGHLYSTTVQSADILYPQLEKFGGPCPVVVPAGTDQDPHIRLVRDLANSLRWFKVEENEGSYFIRSKKASESELMELSQELSSFCDVKEFEEHLEVTEVSSDFDLFEFVREFELKKGGFGFILPSSTYHRFMTGLRGGKMSSSVEGSFIGLTENPDDASEKVMKAKTGGRTSIEEQRKKGGSPEDCSVYELLYFHLIEDEDSIQEIYSTCKKGERLCGKCKKETAELLKDFLKKHQEKRELAKEKLEEFKEWKNGT